MSYLVLARKWRPQVFDDLIGQEPISRILSNALSQGRIAHAYLFSGPRGVGKTSTARILAKALNCEKGPSPVPCGVCGSCRSVSEGSSMDVMEIDGASNNSVNDIRDLREKVKYAPATGRYKVYIIDEAHMLSDSAFNALLKTLEEPPAHVVFVLATTAPRKIPATVLSRCQHLPFRRVPTQKIKERLRRIVESEGIRISEEALDVIGRAAEGSMRDSLTILDQVSAFSSDIEESEIKDLLGITDFRALWELSAAVVGGERKQILAIIADLADTGTDFKSFTKDLMNFFRDLLVAKVVKKPEEILDVSDSELGAIREILKMTTEDFLTLLLSEMIRTESEVRLASAPRIALEMGLLRSSFLSSLKPLREAIECIESYIGEKKGLPESESVAAPREEARRASLTEAAAADTEETKETGIPLSPAPAEEGEREAPAIPQADGPSEGAGPEGVEPETGPATVPALGGGDLWDALLQRIEELNHPLACRLSEGEARLAGDALTITFNGGMAIHVDSVEKNRQMIERVASEIAKRKVTLAIDTVKKKIPRKKEMKEKALSDPVVKEAIELFDGRIVDIKPIENGGRDV